MRQKHRYVSKAHAVVDARHCGLIGLLTVRPLDEGSSTSLDELIVVILPMLKAFLDKLESRTRTIDRSFELSLLIVLASILCDDVPVAPSGSLFADLPELLR